MQKEGKGNISDNNDIEEILPKKKKVLNAFLLIIPSLLLYVLGRLWVGMVSDFIQEKGGGLKLLFFLISESFGFFILAVIPLGIFILGFESVTKTLAISAKGIKYSTIFRKIESDWKDVLKIDVETHKQRSEQTGLVISSKINYIIHTSKGTFSLNEGSVWGWNASTLKNAYDKIICHVPGVEIIQSEVETTVSEGK